MAISAVRGVRFAGRVFDLMRRVRLPLLGFLLIGVLAGLIGLFGLRIDMSFRPLFTADRVELHKTEDFESKFGKAGFNELIAIVEVPGPDRSAALGAIGELAQDLRDLPHVVDVRDPLSFPYFDEQGNANPDGVSAALAAAGSDRERQAIIDAVTAAPSAQRLIFGDGGRHVAVTAQYGIGTSDFRQWRSADKQFRDVVQRWSELHDAGAMVTGYPDVEQV